MEATQQVEVSLEQSEKNESVFDRSNKQKCGICNIATSKYRCPRCDLVTCSLPCVTSHKEKYSCSGKRNRAEFVSLSQFTESTLHSDYNMLTDISRQIYIQPKKIARIQPKPSLYTYRWQLLRNIATQQNIRLQLLPVLSSRRRYTTPHCLHTLFPFFLFSLPTSSEIFCDFLHTKKAYRENTTIFDKKKQAILWRVEWVCPHVPTGKVILYSDKVEDTRMVGEVLFSLIHNTPSTGKMLDSYILKEPDIENWKVLMKVEHRPANDPKYYDLTLNSNFRENLAGKDVVEFPTFYVILQEHLSLYKIQSLDRQHIAQEPENFVNPDEIQIEDVKTEGPGELSQDVMDIIKALLKDTTGIVTDPNQEEIDAHIPEKTASLFESVPDVGEK